ncbi:DNA polymerase IV [Brevibacillus sp. SYSU BS000544]|uniref:DNA polymerase IV n=1 Tax=Brevibacillus sp. SYSU BS000544 TaxID=3416443 RepID=UPI003CE50AD6
MNCTQNNVRRRAILHLDIDAFYASVEQLDQPKYRGKPVIVGGTDNRGVVATCSYEARKYGVRSAMPITLAKKKCPHGIYVQPRFSRYEEKSREIKAVYSQYTDLYERVGLDEAYLDMSHIDNVIPVARQIKDRIHRETGLTCSIGIAENMSLAKIASDLKKPDAFVVIRPHQVLDVLRPLSVGVIHGIGKKSLELLSRRNIHTVEDFWSLTEEEVFRMFGKMGKSLYLMARGIDHREIIMNRPVKSVSRETTLAVDETKRESVLLIASELLGEVLEEIQTDGLQPQTLTLKIKFADFTQRSKQCRIDYPNECDTLLEKLVDFFDYSSGIRLVGVGFSNFVSTQTERYEQLRFF